MPDQKQGECGKGDRLHWCSRPECDCPPAVRFPHPNWARWLSVPVVRVYEAVALSLSREPMHLTDAADESNADIDWRFSDGCRQEVRVEPGRTEADHPPISANVCH